MFWLSGAAYGVEHPSLALILPSPAVSGLIGWLASVIMRTQEGILLNIVVGIVGALIGGWLISPMVGAATINQGDLSLAGLGVSLLGAVILLAIVNLFRGGRSRL